jgi:hypothetical protein
VVIVGSVGTVGFGSDGGREAAAALFVSFRHVLLLQLWPQPHAEDQERSGSCHHRRPLEPNGLAHGCPPGRLTTGAQDGSNEQLVVPQQVDGDAVCDRACVWHTM